MTLHKSQERHIEYPAKLTFKAVFRNVPHTADSIRSILTASELEGSVTMKESSGSKFISYTVTAVFPSATMLNDICGRVAGLEGYMTLF